MPRIIQNRSAEEIENERTLKESREMLELLKRSTPTEINGQWALVLDPTDKVEWENRIKAKGAQI